MLTRFFAGFRKLGSSSRNLRKVSLQPFGILDKLKPDSYEDKFKKEIEFFANKPDYTLRDFEEKVERVTEVERKHRADEQQFR